MNFGIPINKDVKSGKADFSLAAKALSKIHKMTLDEAQHGRSVALWCCLIYFFVDCLIGKNGTVLIFFVGTR